MNKIKVLLIEDDRSISNFITATMDREGYKIMHALNGREGLSLSTSFCPKDSTGKLHSRYTTIRNCI